MSRTLLAARPAGVAIPTPETNFGSNLKGTWDYRSAYVPNGASSAWDDQSSVNANLIQNDGTNHPGSVSVGGKAGGASFDGTGQNLMDNVGAMSNRLTNNALGIFFVGKSPATGLATEVTPNTDGPMIADSGGYLGATWTTTPRAFVFDGAYKNTPAASLAADTLFAAMITHDGSTLRFKITGSTEKTVAAGNVGSMAGSLRVCRPWTGSLRGKGDVGCIHTVNINPSAGQKTNEDNWLNAEYTVRFST